MRRRYLIAVVTALAVGGGVAWSGAWGVGAPAPHADPEVLRRVGQDAEPATTQLPGWRGGLVRAGTGERVRVEVSESYSEEAISSQAWADFFGQLVHGSELASVTVRIAPPAEVAAVCGEHALACYGQSTLVIPGEPSGGISAEELARHEYGHHIAANRLNPPWRAAYWGPKHWASRAQICARTAAGTAFPDRVAWWGKYRRDPAEAFAEAYRVLNERRTGTALTWSIVDDSFIPDDAALRAVEQDVTSPWTSRTRTAYRGRTTRGAWRRVIRVATPLDGELTAELLLPAGRLDRLELLSPDGRVLARGLWAGASTRRLSFTLCGQRRLLLRVTGTRVPGRFQLVVTRP